MVLGSRLTRSATSVVVYRSEGVDLGDLHVAQLKYFQSTTLPLSIYEQIGIANINAATR